MVEIWIEKRRDEKMDRYMNSSGWEMSKMGM